MRKGPNCLTHQLGNLVKQAERLLCLFDLLFLCVLLLGCRCCCWSAREALGFGARSSFHAMAAMARLFLTPVLLLALLLSAAAADTAFLLVHKKASLQRLNKDAERVKVGITIHNAGFRLVWLPQPLCFSKLPLLLGVFVGDPRSLSFCCSLVSPSNRRELIGGEGALMPVRWCCYCDAFV